MSAPRKLQHIGVQVHLCKPGAPTVVERECGPTRDPPQPVSIDIGPASSTVVAQMPLTTRRKSRTAWAFTKQPPAREKCSARAKAPYSRPNTRTRLHPRTQLPAGIASSGRTRPAVPGATERADQSTMRGILPRGEASCLDATILAS